MHLISLTQELGETSATREQEARRSIEVRTELSEGSDFTVLCKVELERTSELLHDLAVSGSILFISKGSMTFS